MFRLIIIFQSINNWQWTFWWMLFFLNTRVISNCYVILFFTLLRKKANEKERLLSFYLLVSKVNKLNQTCFSTFFFSFRQCWRQLSSGTGLFMFAVACSDSIRRTRDSAVYTGTVFTFLKRIAQCLFELLLMIACKTIARG